MNKNSVTEMLEAQHQNQKEQYINNFLMEIKDILIERQKEYGEPKEHFQEIADLWNGFRKGEPIPPEGVVIKLLLMKIARLNNVTDIKDTIQDAIGYLVCYAQIMDEDLED